MKTYQINQVVKTNMPFTGTIAKITHIQQDFDGNVLYYRGEVITLPKVKQTARKVNRIRVGTAINFLPESIK